MDTYDYPLESPLRKRSASVEIDRISRLPDDVICRILSFVTPTKYIIRTRLLSKRWENLWALIPKLVLKLDQHFIYEFKKDPTYKRCKELYANTFINSVDNLLFLRDCLHIESFKLDFGSGVVPSRLRPSSWICAIVMCRITKLDLTIESYSNTSNLGELPWCLFTCKTLVVLKLSGKFILNLPYYVCLSNLKTLCLENVIYLGDSSIQKLLSGCPIIEDLEILRDDWDHMRTLNVGISSLKRLKLRGCTFDEEVYQYGDDTNKVVVDAPNLEFVHFVDSWSDDITLKPFPSIIEAHIDISRFEETRKELLLSSLLQSIVNVRRLFLLEGSLTLLWINRDPNLPTFYNLVHLELKYSPDDGPIQLMDFLRCSPKLEALSLSGGIYTYAYQRDLDCKFRKNNPAKVPECLRHSLKTVEIQAFEGVKFEFNIVKYLLENALVLEKMTIYCQRPPTDVKFGKIQTKLTNFRRLSIDCELEVLCKD